MPASPSIVRLASTPSTLDALHALAEAGAESGTAVVAEVQEAGRGSRGRSWSSPRGGLWLSVLARPRAAALEVLSLRAGLAVAELLETLGAEGRIALKWPNDLMLDDRKCGGILCEARWQGDVLAWVVVGLGLNVTNPVPKELQPVAANLSDRLPGVSPADLGEPIAAVLRGVSTDGARLNDSEIGRFDDRDWLRGRRLKSPAAGVAYGIADDGALWVRLPGGSDLPVRAGPVELAESSVQA